MNYISFHVLADYYISNFKFKTVTINVIYFMISTFNYNNHYALHVPYNLICGFLRHSSCIFLPERNLYFQYTI